MLLPRRFPRRRPRAVIFETLENRHLLATTLDAGVGLMSNVPYSADAAWVDVRNLFGAWGSYNDPTTPNPSLALTADGYPLAPASTLSYLVGYPDGTYTLSYTGTATISFSGMGATMGPVTTNADGVSTATVTIDPSQGGRLIMQVSGLDPNHPLDNLHLIAPGYDPNNPPIFTTTFLQRLQPFSTIRFMGWMRTDDTTVQNWSDRTLPNDFLQTGPAGPAYEYMVDLANTLNKNIWINIPAQATDDYVTQMADFLLANLNPDIKIYVEYSNELWNMVYPQYQYNLTQAEANPLLTATNSFKRAGQEAAYRLMQIGQIFDQQFGSQADRILPVLGGQATYTAFLSAGLSFINTAFGPPSNYFAAIAIAPYVRLLPSDDVPGMTMTQLFAAMNKYLNSTLASGIAANAALAQQYGLAMDAYEGGQGLVAWNRRLHKNTNYKLKLAAQNDPRMGQLYRSLAALWQQDGGALFNYSALTFRPNSSGMWGLLPTEQAVGSVKWDTVLSLLLPSGDANLDGQVDYSDFLILQRNYGLKNRWWQTADFNRDSQVNTTDFQLLWNNLDTALLTLTQLSQIESFGQRIGVLTPTNTAVSAPAVTYNGDGLVTVTVTSSQGTPAGRVRLLVAGGSPLSQPLVDGSATFDLPGLAAGVYSLSVAYLGQGDFLPSSNLGTLTIQPAATTTSLSAPEITYGGNGTVTVTVATGTGVPTPTGTVALEVDGGSPLTQVLNAQGTTTFILTGLTAEAHTLLVSYASQGNYLSSSTSGTINVAQATPVITWANPADITYGTPLDATQLDATANVPGTFTYTPNAGTVLGAGQGQTLSVIFTPDDSIDYSTVSATVTINVAQATPVITWANPADITYGTPLDATQLDATANVPGTFTYTPNAGTILPVGPGQTLSVIFTPDDSIDYTTVAATVTINVLSASTSATIDTHSISASADTGSDVAMSPFVVAVLVPSASSAVDPMQVVPRKPSSRGAVVDVSIEDLVASAISGMLN